MTVTPHPAAVDHQMPMIAIIDDNAAVREAVRFLLHTYGFTVVTYESGAEFLAEVPSIALLIVDQDMPGLSGLQVVRRFRRAVSATAPVLMFGAVLGPDIAAQAADLGVTRVLHKPVALDLVEAVQSAIAPTECSPKT
ncbi:MAG: response regulator [Alphaproteobacteria bacterium]|nr:response regulator [Alphaproteobacteria bacterium]